MFKSEAFRTLAAASFFAASSLLSAQAQLTTPQTAATSAADHPSIFIRYQYSLSDILTRLQVLEKTGQSLASDPTAKNWLDEMGWRALVQKYENTAFELTAELKENLLKQDKFLATTFSYEVGDAVWVPAEEKEHPYGLRQFQVNQRAQIINIIRGEVETYFVVQVGVDNGGQGGMAMVPGKYYDGRPGPILDYTADFKVETKTYIYSLSEIESLNTPFRSAHKGSDTGAQVDYTSDTKWLEKISKFKDKVVAMNLTIDFTKSGQEIYKKQLAMVLQIFREFKMDRNAPSGGPLLGGVASGGGVCFTQACVLSHAIHAVGEPYGITAVNLNGMTVNPQGGHGFVRVIIRGPEEVHVYDVAPSHRGLTPQFHGYKISSSKISAISDPGWADYGKTPDQFAWTPIEDALNPKPVDANRAVSDVIKGKPIEVIENYGNQGPWRGKEAFKGQMFAGTNMGEFLKPKGQISDAAQIERSVSKPELDKMTSEAEALKARIMSEPTGSLRGVKTSILKDVVEPRLGQLAVGALTRDGLTISLTEYLFRSLK